MGYFDGLVAASFKTADDGTPLYYPFGILGKGYILPSEERKLEVQRSLKRYYIVMLPLSSIASAVLLMAAISMRWLLVLFLWVALLVGISLLAYAFTSNLAKGLVASESRLSFREAYRNSAKSHSWFSLWYLEIVSLVFVVMSLLMIKSTSGDYLFIGLAGAVFSGLCSVVFAFMIKAKSQ